MGREIREIKVGNAQLGSLRIMLATLKYTLDQTCEKYIQTGLANESLSDRQDARAQCVEVGSM